MDYNLAALKLLCGQLKKAVQTSENSSPSSPMSLGGILFQRAWLQGILVSGSKQEGHFQLDDGSGLINLFLSTEYLHREWKLGMYVMVVGAYIFRKEEPPIIKVHKMVDLSAYPDREAMWHLEVIEAYNMFYSDE